MRKRVLLAVLTMSFAAMNLYADVPGPGPRPLPPIRLGDGQLLPLPQESVKVTLEVVRNPNFTSGTLVLPKELFGALKKGNAQGPASTLPGGVLALAFTGSLVAGGLWLARVPRAKCLVGIMLPLFGLALLDSTLHAQPARLEAPRPVVEAAKVTITRGEAGQVVLVLPSKR